MVGREDPLIPGKGGRKKEGRSRGCLLKGAYGWGGAGGGGNRKEIEARDMKLKGSSWGSPTLRCGRDWEDISPAILVIWEGIRVISDVQWYRSNVLCVCVCGGVISSICLSPALFCQGHPQTLGAV